MEKEIRTYLQRNLKINWCRRGCAEWIFKQPGDRRGWACRWDDK